MKVIALGADLTDATVTSVGEILSSMPFTFSDNLVHNRNWFFWYLGDLSWPKGTKEVRAPGIPQLRLPHSFVNNPRLSDCILHGWSLDPE